MCGICGIVAPDGRYQPGDLDALARRMTAAMLHRGPDSGGHLADPGIALGMRRLSIIDRATGQQPLFNEDGSIAVVCNGEIYNFQELREELRGKGHRFHSVSDTEVIVHAYEEWDEECLSHLRGMFALAIYDRRRTAHRGARRLLLARDRLGIKPFYYACLDGGRVVFASEVRALLASGLVARELSPAGVESYLLFGSVSEPATLVDGVRSLPPGHALSLQVGPPINGCQPRQYWTLLPAASASAASASTTAVSTTAAPTPRAPVRTASIRAATAQAPAEGTPARALRTLLEDSIRVHLVADEPLGVFLSGGVDSTAIAALASQARAGVRCYTIRFREREFDESDVARRTATRLGVEHCELLVEAGEMLDGMDAALAALDQPSVDGINTYCVSAAVRRAGAKVALSGLGGDELFGGYRTFRWMASLGRLSAVARHSPAAMRHAGATAIAAAGAWMGRAGDSDRLAALCREPDALPHPFFFTRTIFDPDATRGLCRHNDHRDNDYRDNDHSDNGHGGNGHRHNGHHHNRRHDGGSQNGCRESEPWRRWNEDTSAVARQCGAFTAVSYLELRSYMLNTLLRDADAMSMAHSLELRVPLLDHHIVEFVSAQPDRVKQRAGAYKPLLVEALGDLLPPEVSERPKQGFTFPWATWIRGPLAPRVEAGLRDLAPPLARHLDPEAVNAAWAAFLAGRSGWLRPWSLFVLNEWTRRHL
jgi:asparagine synthase (glutamine-hydrolysing)